MTKKLQFICLAAACALIAGLPGGATRTAKATERAAVNHTLGTETVTVVDDTTKLYTPIAAQTDEDYYPYSRKWNGMPSVITAGNNIFVAWQTGGVREPDPDKLNYITVAASADGGVTWKDPFIIIDPPEDDKQAQVPMFYYTHAGELHLLFSYEGVGIHSLVLHNADGPLDGITYDAPVPVGTKNSSFTKPTLLSDGTIMYASGTTDTTIFLSQDDGRTYTAIAKTESQAPASARKFSESSVVEKRDGTLWHLRRLENAVNGGIEQSFSADGVTWSVAVGDLGYPLQSPGSRFTMQRLASGALLFVTNAAGIGTDRTKMTAYLSDDDGDTWPYALSLDAETSSYPDFWQDKTTGTIYIAFDKDRYGEGGIRLCAVTEEDIRAGQYISERAAQLIIVAKINGAYGDIKTVNGAFARTMYYSVGTSLETVLTDLPTTVSVTDDNGKTQSLTGKYRVSGYKAEQAGAYKAYFVTDLPPYLKDSFGMLEFEIVLQDKKAGCGGAAAGGCALGALGCLACAAAGLKKGRRRK